MNDIVIEINKGMIANIFCDTPDVRFIVIDWDLKERQEGTVVTVERHAPLVRVSKNARNQIDQLG